MADEQEDGIEAAEQVAEVAEPGSHPIKKLEAFIKRHLGQTTELAGHVTTIAEKAQGAFDGVVRVVADLRVLRTETANKFVQVSSDVSGAESRIEELLTRVAALEKAAAPDVSPELAKSADDVEKAVADVASAAQASATPGELPGDGEAPQG